MSPLPEGHMGHFKLHIFVGSIIKSGGYPQIIGLLIILEINIEVYILNKLIIRLGVTPTFINRRDLIRDFKGTIIINIHF
jgi:hypothetical protein